MKRIIAEAWAVGECSSEGATARVVLTEDMINALFVAAQAGDTLELVVETGVERGFRGSDITPADDPDSWGRATIVATPNGEVAE